MKKLLIIDDEIIIRQRLKKLLELDNYKVYTAENGPKGLLLYKKQKPELVILDIKIPGMDGIEILKHIKEY